MPASFNYAAFFDHQDLLGRADGAQAVGNGDDGPLTGQIVYGLAYLLLRLNVNSGRGFIQDDDR